MLAAGDHHGVKRQPEVEVYLRGCSIEQVLGWIRDAVGQLTGPVDCGETMAYQTVAGAVILRPGVEGGPFLGVWFNTPARPWATDIDCARAAARDLGCVARCDASSEHPELPPSADVWLEVVDGVERLVAWEPDDEPDTPPNRGRI